MTGGGDWQKTAEGVLLNPCSFCGHSSAAALLVHQPKPKTQSLMLVPGFSALLLVRDRTSADDSLSLKCNAYPPFLPLID